MSEFSRHPTTAVSRDVVNGRHVTTLFFVDLGLMVLRRCPAVTAESCPCRPDHLSAGQRGIQLLQRETSDLTATVN